MVLGSALSAIDAGADYLISQGKHFTDKTSQNEALHQQITVLLSGTFLREVMGWSSEELEAPRHRTWRDL